MLVLVVKGLGVFLRPCKVGNQDGAREEMSTETRSTASRVPTPPQGGLFVREVRRKGSGSGTRNTGEGAVDAEAVSGSWPTQEMEGSGNSPVLFVFLFRFHFLF